jgi:thymidylate synthase
LFNAVRNAARLYVPQLVAAGKVSHSQPRQGHVPSIHVIGRTLGEVWENATMALLAVGHDARTGYDLVDKKGNYTSFPSLEGTVLMHIENPFGEPRLHKNFLAGWAGLGDYKAEIEGVKDGWMVATPDRVIQSMKKGNFHLRSSGEADSNGKKESLLHSKEWKYTYHQRLFGYSYVDIEAQPQTINQMGCLIDKLTREPMSKSAQAITWDPRFDHNDGQMIYSRRKRIKDPTTGKRKTVIEEGLRARFAEYDSPCLQRLWFRLLPDGKDGYVLNMNTDWRSRDHLKAVPQNIFAITEIYFEGVRAALQERLKKTVKMGRYCDKSDSLHLYGHYLDFSKGEKGTVSNDVTNYLADMLRTARGQSYRKRFVICKDPNDSDDMFNIAMSQIKEEYEWRRTNPNAGRNL